MIEVCSVAVLTLCCFFFRFRATGSFERNTERNIYYKTIKGPETKKKKNNNTRSERQPNTPQSYPKRAEDKQHLCPLLETPVSYEENLR